MKNIFNLQLDLVKIVTVILLLVGSSAQRVFAQQESQYTQYMYNTSTINPAYAGSQEALSAILLYRNQWLNIDGAPKTLNFTMHSQLGRRTGGAITFISDKIGPSVESTLSTDFSYTVPVGEYAQLAFGVKGGLSMLNVDYTELSIFNPGDDVFQENIDNRISPIAGAGVYYYNDKFYAGVSVPNLLSTRYSDNTAISEARQRPNFYLITGYVFDINRDLLFKPAFLTKAVSGAPIAVDISANFLYKQKFTLGAAYRAGAAISGLAGFQLSDTIQLGYSYDSNINSINNFTPGSHEIFLSFSLGLKRDDRLLQPRFF